MNPQAVCFGRRISLVALASSSLSPKFRLKTVCRWKDRALSHAFNLQPLKKENGLGCQSPTQPVDNARLPARSDEPTELEHTHLPDAKDIFIDDLSATLDAHRDRNKASVTRRVDQDIKGRLPFLRPLPKVSLTSHTNDETIPGDDVHSRFLATTLPKESVINKAKDDTSEPLKVQRRTTPAQWASFYWPADAVQLAELTGKIYKRKPSEVMEYKPCLLTPQGVFDARPREPQRPWLAFLGNPESLNPGQSNQRLFAELKAYESYMRLSAIEEEAAGLLAGKVEALVGKKYTHNPLNLVGSYSTGLADRLSDLDFNISFPKFEKEPLERGPSSTRKKARKAADRVLHHMKGVLRYRSQPFRGVELIHARIPIVKAEHYPTNLRIEIKTLSSNQNAKEYIACYLAEYPTLRTLYVVLRSALHIRDLTNVHKGGLGSYAIFMMIVNALKHASEKYARNDLASHFLYILEFYGNADLYSYGFSPDPPRVVPKKGKTISAKEKAARLQDPMLRGIDILGPHNPQKPYLLFLQDPANPVNDLGHKAYGIKHVQYLFGNFAESLRETMRLLDKGVFKTHIWLRTHGLLGNFLEANYTSLQSRRQRMKEWVEEERTKLWDTGLAALKPGDASQGKVLGDRAKSGPAKRETMQTQQPSHLPALETPQALSQALFKRTVYQDAPPSNAPPFEPPDYDPIEPRAHDGTATPDPGRLLRGETTRPEIQPKADDLEISSKSFWQVIDLVITERQQGDRTAAIDAWKAYSNEERKKALRELDEKLALKDVAEETAIANTASAPSFSLNRLSATIKLRSVKNQALRKQFLRNTYFAPHHKA